MATIICSVLILCIIGYVACSDSILRKPTLIKVLIGIVVILFAVLVYLDIKDSVW